VATIGGTWEQTSDKYRVLSVSWKTCLRDQFGIRDTNLKSYPQLMIK